MRLVLGEGATVLSRLFAPRSLRAVYVNFPDPWDKKRHRHRRLVNVAFLRLLASRLEMDGVFIFTTDSKDYMQELLRLLQGFPALTPLTVEVVDSQTATEWQICFETKYARKWKQAGRLIYHLRIQKVQEYHIESWVVELYPLAERTERTERTEGDAMPHVVIEGRINLTEVCERLPVGVIWRDGSCVIKVIDLYHSRQRSASALDVVIVEGKLMQRFLLSLKCQENQTLIGLHDTAHLDVTWGVKVAVGLLARTVMQLSPGSRIKRSTLGKSVERTLEELAKSGDGGLRAESPRY